MLIRPSALLLASIAGLSMAVGTVAVPSATAAPPATRTVSFTSADVTAGTTTWTVPAGVTSLTVGTVGGNGGDSLNGSVGGLGAAITAVISVTPGQVLTIAVGSQGGSGRGGLPGGGSNNNPVPGGGGGFSGVLDAAQTPLVIAGAGGGGGLFDGRGGDAGEAAPDVSQSGRTAGGGGAGTQSTGGAGGAGAAPGLPGTALQGGGTTGGSGGGGGGGFYGGGGGGTNFTGGGGGGGSSFPAAGSPSVVAWGLKTRSDAVDGSVTIRYTATLVAPVLTATTPAATATRGTAYSYTFTATGDPAPTFSVSSGTLPPGLTLTPSGVLSGVPLVAGQARFQVAASNGVDPVAVSAPLTIEILGAPAFTASAPPAVATVGTAYSYAFAAVGNPTSTFAVSDGELPAGLTLSSAGVLSGVPTAAGRSAFRITASNGVSPDATTDSLTIDVAAAPVFTARTPPATATVGAGYSYEFVASGAPEATFRIGTGSLPAGLTLAADGVLSGVPTAAGVATFTVIATNGVGPDAVVGPLVITVVAPGPRSTAVAAPLARTGMPLHPAAPVAAVLLLAGGLLALARVRRRS